jgi:hypothetical protein
MHPPTNILINLNNFVKKHVNLQDIILENLPKFHTNRSHIKELPILSPNTKIKRYQLAIAPTFCLIDFKAQGQTINRLIIDLCQPLDYAPL